MIHKSPSENSSNDRLGAIENKVEDLQKCVESTLSVLLETINLHFINSKKYNIYLGYYILYNTVYMLRFFVFGLKCYLYNYI